MPGDVSVVAFALCCLAAAGGAVVQSVVGFGYALLVVPTLLLVREDLIPVAPLVMAAPMVLWLAWVHRRGFDRAGFVRMSLGRIPGTAVGLWVLGLLGAAAISQVAGAALIAAAALSFLRGPRRASPRLEVAAGFVSGVAGTVSAVGGPYLGLAYAARSPETLRATVSAAFAVGILLSLVALAADGRLAGAPVALAAALVPATVLGLWLGARVADRVDHDVVRSAILLVAAAAGALAVVLGVVR